MLKKRNRLTSNRAFHATYSNRKTLRDANLLLYLGQEKDDKNYPTRVGFVVSKKTHKRAVKRNRIKRLLRENLRLMIKKGEFEEINNYRSLILSANGGLLDKSFEEVKSIISGLFSKLRGK